jgi:hypothetical protein
MLDDEITSSNIILKDGQIISQSLNHSLSVTIDTLTLKKKTKFWLQTFRNGLLHKKVSEPLG